MILPRLISLMVFGKLSPIMGESVLEVVKLAT